MGSLHWSAPALALACLAIAPRASAYCRTVTTPIPADFPQTQECFAPAESLPLWWSNACVGFSVQEDASKQISLADAESHALTAFQRWMGATCPGGGTPSITISDEGPVACDTVEYSGAGPNQHVIIFRDTDWPHGEDPYNTLALTTVSFNVTTGEIYDADIEVNTLDTSLAVTTPPAAGQFSFDAIITHEAGHFLGLAHTPIETAVMYASYSAGTTGLTADDVAGICAVYAPDGSRAHEVDAGAGTTAPEIAQAAACDPTPRHGFGSECGPITTTEPETVTPKRGCSIGTSPGGASGPLWPTLALFFSAVGVRIARRRQTARIPGMRRLRMVALSSLLVVGVATASPLLVEHAAHASVSITVLFDELVRDSDAIAIVTPYEAKTVWEDGRIVTYTHVHADRMVGGSVDGDPWVRTLGGTVGKIGQIVDGEPVLTVGRPGLLFLRAATASGGGVYAVTARAQGQYPVVLGDKNVSVFHASSGAGGLVPTPTARVAQMTQLRVKAGLAAEAPRATDVLHTRPVEDGVRDVAAAWVRIHGTK